MKKRSFLALVILMAISLSLFTACGDKKIIKEKEKKQVTIKVAYWALSPEEDRFISERIEENNKKNTLIKIEKKIIQGDYYKKLEQEVISEEGPDVFLLDGTEGQKYLDKITLPIDSYIDDIQMSDFYDFHKNLLVAFKKDGRIHAIPRDYTPLALFYNKDIMKKAGVNPPKNWAELEQVSKVLSQKGIKPLTLSYDASRLSTFIFQAGGKINDDDQMSFNTVYAAKGLEFYCSLFQKAYAVTPQELGEKDMKDAFIHNKAAMVIEDISMINYIKQNASKFNYGIAELPQGKNTGNIVFTTGYAVNRYTKNKVEAIEAIKFLTSKETQQVQASRGISIPSRKSVEDIYCSEYPERKPLVDTGKDAFVFNYGEKHKDIKAVLEKYAMKLKTGEIKDSKEALELAEKELKKDDKK